MTEEPRAAEHRRELERRQRRWNFWSDHWGFVERDTVGIRRETIDQLGLEPGDTVLDLGCGPGVNLEMLAEAVGPAGRVIGVDLSPKMLERALDRIDDRGLEPVELVLADATRPVVKSGRIDALVATTAVSSTPAVWSTVEQIHRSLRPGGRVALYEIRRVPSGVGRVLNPLVARFFRWFGSWNDDEDVLEALEGTFGTTEIVATYALGTNYIVVAEKRSNATSHRG